ncbi:type IV secretory system conjugative DNA transfer family protein [Microlunatus sp. Y2014]|uniref:type IV secretory system conjugative DNA transfer family protein n=1 Tax=Microlunatus sp. Y2014 TaxID=3418488 RepID=UPI003DA6F4FC
MMPELITLPGGIVVEWWQLVVLLVGLVGLAAAKVLLNKPARPRSSRDEVARARDTSPVWATRADVQGLVTAEYDPRRVRLGYLGPDLLCNPLLRSLLVLAPTGAGKTPRVVVPNVLVHRGPVLAGSVKGDLLHLTVKRRREFGPVTVFDPTDVSGQANCRWSPLAAITTYADAGRAASWLSESSKSGNAGVEAAQFWDSLGRRMLAPMLFAAARTRETMSTVARWTQLQQYEKVTAILDEIDDPDAIMGWSAFVNTHARTRDSVANTGWTVLEAWAHPDVRHAVGVTADDWDGLDIDQLLTDYGTLYLVAPASEQRFFTPIFETLVNAVLQRVETMAAQRQGIALDPPLLLALDEAANVAPLRRLDQIASKGAGEGIVLLTVWQNEAQIDKIYGAVDARTILGNHTARLYMSGITDQQTLDSLSRLIGTDTIDRETTQTDRDGRTSRSRTPTDIEVAPSPWLRQLPDDVAVLITSKFKPAKVSLPGWWEDDTLRPLVDPAVAAAYDTAHGSHDSKPRRAARKQKQTA